MEQIVQFLVVALSGVLYAFIYQVIKIAGGWKDLKAQLLGFFFALIVGGVIAWITGLAQLTWPPQDPSLLFTQLLAIGGVVNEIAKAVYRKWIKKATPETEPPIPTS